MSNTAKAEAESPRPLLHRAKRAFQQLGVSDATGWRLISDGVLDVVRIGGGTLVTDASLQRVAQTGVAVVRGKGQRRSGRLAPEAAA